MVVIPGGCARRWKRTWCRWGQPGVGCGVRIRLWGTWWRGKHCNGDVALCRRCLDYFYSSFVVRPHRRLAIIRATFNREYFLYSLVTVSLVADDEILYSNLYIFCRKKLFSDTAAEPIFPECYARLLMQPSSCVSFDVSGRPSSSFSSRRYCKTIPECPTMWPNTWGNWMRNLSFKGLPRNKWKYFLINIAN